MLCSKGGQEGRQGGRQVAPKATKVITNESKAGMHAGGQPANQAGSPKGAESHERRNQRQAGSPKGDESYKTTKAKAGRQAALKATKVMTYEIAGRQAALLATKVMTYEIKGRQVGNPKGDESYKR